MDEHLEPAICRLVAELLSPLLYQSQGADDERPLRFGPWFLSCLIECSQDETDRLNCLAKAHLLLWMSTIHQGIYLSICLSYILIETC